jgi:carbamoyl-phosphate synthase small subunit
MMRPHLPEGRQRCTLELSDGNRFEGELIGAPITTSGQLVFTTGMVGYSEAMTDPSYFGQILVFTYPLIGNYGIPSPPKALELPIPRGFESAKVHTSGAILTIDSEEAFHWNSFVSLDNWLREQGVPGIVGLDTRHLVHLVRQTPNLLGRIVPIDGSSGGDSASERNLRFFDPGQESVVTKVSTSTRRVLGSGSVRIGLVDCGVKWNIIRQLIDQGCEVELLPWNTDLSTVDCQGWLLSNGPGDPMLTGDLRSRVAHLLEEDRPILGICLGHQILSLAAGAKTKKMQYGHRSHNQPVYLVGSRKGFITSQNHGYVVDEDTLPADWKPWFKNANDQTNEGIRHVSRPFCSVQFHPEAAGGPRDTGWILEQFVREVKTRCL